MKEIFCRIDRCLGCKSCELACAIEHSCGQNLLSAVKEYPLPAARVFVQKFEAPGSFTISQAVAVQCRQCAEPMCAAACITGGIVKDESSGLVRFNHDKCLGCWSCTMICPFAAIVRERYCAKAVKCDRCEDRIIPACVEACPTKALVFCETEEFDEFYREAEAER